ncbi:hypothetical protein NL676_025788 [Syzygium grande]|nr:hypothetical protein NL676_025788 [Syzygium grande]
MFFLFSPILSLSSEISESLSIALWGRYRVRKEGVRWNDEAGLKDYLFKRHSESASFTWWWEQVQLREHKIRRRKATAGGGSVSDPELWKKMTDHMYHDKQGLEQAWNKKNKWLLFVLGGLISDRLS